MNSVLGWKVELLRPILGNESIFAQYPVTCLSFSVKNDVLVQLALNNSESPLTLFEAHKHVFSHSSSVRRFDRRQRRLLLKTITILKIGLFINRQVSVPGSNVKSWFRGTARRCYCSKDAVNRLGIAWGSSEQRTVGGIHGG